MTGDCHVRFSESARVRFPRATRHNRADRDQISMNTDTCNLQLHGIGGGKKVKIAICKQQLAGVGQDIFMASIFAFHAGKDGILVAVI
jgi:hypothetical protein